MIYYFRHVSIHLRFLFDWINAIRYRVEFSSYCTEYQKKKMFTVCLDSFTEFIVHKQRRAIIFAQQVSFFC